MIKFDENITVPKGKTVIDFESDLLCIGERVLSRNIKLMVTGGQKICIIGKNGIGKSTLLKKITEQILDREDIKVGYMPQDYEEMLDLTLTPVEFCRKPEKKKRSQESEPI